VEAPIRRGIRMSRATATKLMLGLMGLAFFFLLWSLAYEITVGLRWNPAMPGEGKLRWGLLQVQNAARDFSALTIAPNHFLARISFPATRGETAIRALIAGGAVISFGFALWIVSIILKKPKPYGDAKFGSLLIAEKKRLTSGRGLILGTLNGATITSDEPAHVLVVGPTRSGKGVSFVIPNGYTWEGSSVWFDPKRENFGAFAAHRTIMGDKVFLFSPGEDHTHRYNPLDFIRRDDRMATDALVVASFLIPESKPEIWGKSARLLLAAMIGYTLASPLHAEAEHLRSVSKLTTTGEDFQLVLKTLVKTESGHLPSWVVDGFNQFIALEKETRNSALFNVTTALNPWNSGLIAAATETSDFDIRTFRQTKTALFIGCSIAQLEVYRPLIKILVQQIHDLLMAKLPDKEKEPHRVLMMIDEFRQLGKMDDLVSKLTINAGYGFRMVLILQDLGQLDEVYGKATRITTVSACQVKLFIRINDLETSDYVSEMLGTRTLEIASPTIRPGQGWFGGVQKSIRYESAPLRTPAELREMPEDRAILIIPNSPGFELRKIAHWRDRPYKAVHDANLFKAHPLPEPKPWKDAAAEIVKAQVVEEEEPAEAVVAAPVVRAKPEAQAANALAVGVPPETIPPVSSPEQPEQEADDTILLADLIESARGEASATFEKFALGAGTPTLKKRVREFGDDQN